MDPHAALGCFCSLAPVILSLHWGWTMNEASDRYKIAKLEEEVKKAPTVDYKSMACIFDASSWIEDQKKRRTSGELAWPSAA